MKLRLFLICSALVLPHFASAQQPIRIHVFVRNDASGFVDTDSKNKQSTLTDVTKAMRDKKYAKTIELVDDVTAPVQVEVAWRGKLTTDKTTGDVVAYAPGVINTSQQPITQDNIKLVLSVGEYIKDFWGLQPNKKDWLGNVPQRFWGDLAKNAVSEIAKWIEDNRAQLSTTVATEHSDVR